jgi:hypothetical protein
MPKDKTGKDVEEVNPLKKDELYTMYNTRTKDGGLAESHTPITEEDVDDEELDDGGQPIVPDEQEDEPEVPETLTDEQVQYLMNLPDAKLLEYGIDDPKQWKSYQRALTKANLELKQLKEAQVQPGVLQELNALKAQIANLSQPPVQKSEPLKPPVAPQMPRKPANFDWSQVAVNGSPEQLYMDEKEQFDREQYQYQVDLSNYNMRVFSGVVQTFEEDKKLRDEERRNMAVRNDGIKRLVSAGLSVSEAQDAWDNATNPERLKDFYSPENIAKLYKIQNGTYKPNPNDRKTKNFIRNKNKKNTWFPPGLGGGNGGGDRVNPNEFSKSSDHTNLYKTTK